MSDMPALCRDHADTLRRWRRIWPNEDEDDFARRARTVAGQCRDCIDAQGANQ